MNTKVFSRLFWTACGLLGAVWALSPAALGADTVKIGYVDIDRIAQESTYIRSMMSDLEKSLTQKKDLVESKQDAYSSLRDEIERKRSVVSEADLEEMMSRSRRLRIEIDEEGAELNRMLRRAERDRMEPALDRVLDVIRTIGKEEKYDLIVRGEIVLYGSSAVDVTDKVIKRIDRDAAAAPASGRSGAASEKTTSKGSGKHAPSVAAE
ncbi:OmpH family outer membrane protein [Candidatus Sumerlaeota bacterium]|nr:OmpH family outer membrane protein [Candidatus Sumerlaeota bacterium]